MIQIVAIIYVIIIAVSLTEGRTLIKKGLWKEVVSVGVLMVLSATLITVRKLGLQTPAEILFNLLSPIGRIFFSHE